MALWISLLAGVAIVAVGELLALARQRRLLLLDPQRRRFFVQYAQQGPGGRVRRNGRATLAPAALQKGTPTNGERGVPHIPDALAKVVSAEAIVYVDISGRCTFANRAARDLLQWTAGELALGDVLGGGRREGAALLESLAQLGMIEDYPATLARGAASPLEIDGVALRDRDDNIWGAALFIRPVARRERMRARG